MSDALRPSRSIVSNSERPCSAINCSRSRSHILYATCGRCATSLLGRRASMKLSTRTVTLAASTGSSETCSLIIYAHFLPCHCRLVPSKYTLEIPLALLFIQSPTGQLSFREGLRRGNEASGVANSRELRGSEGNEKGQSCSAPRPSLGVKARPAAPLRRG